MMERYFEAEEDNEGDLNPVKSVFACGKCDLVDIDPKDHKDHCVFLTEPIEVMIERELSDYDDIEAKCAVMYALLRKIHTVKNNG